MFSATPHLAYRIPGRIVLAAPLSEAWTLQKPENTSIETSDHCHVSLVLALDARLSPIVVGDKA